MSGGGEATRAPAGAGAPPAGGPAVSGRGLRKRFNGQVAVDGIDFDVAPGTCFGFLGPNGAGKTTTMKMIYGLASVADGSLRVLGLDAAHERRRIKARLGVVPQETNLDGELSVSENLLVQARYFGIEQGIARQRAAELLAFAQLTDRADARPDELSGGMKRRLLIARALVNEPELVVLDEPTTGLDPQARLAVWRSLDRLRRHGVTLLLTTHYMEEAERLCDRLVIMDEGRIVAGGDPAALIREHAGREVLELEPGDGCDAEELIATLRPGSVDGGSERHPAVTAADRSDGTVVLYTEDAEALLESLDHERFPTDSALVRRATLEDVFLRLTGRSLRE